ncbi:hypothetical protein RHMOL_Rhmol07G0113400 [Rhododendron molle]|uniref:Uncharacterized protein n=1 Tax=Rhododendron molle TaxID=49168 RepID=A0ACC0N0Y3_RHOML|nr:hypothetical protein RHMOL_Rhmol07G0113400 [Rhododendron molle]
MLKKNSKATGMLSPARQSTGGGGGGGLQVAGLEVRPGGMLVQQRNSDQIFSGPKVKVRVKYGSACHEISILPQSSFGDLKKMLAGLTGLHPNDQKLIYKEKERNSRAFLDEVGVTNGSKLVLVEDVLSRERRVLESRRNEKIDKASKAIAEIRLEIDKLAKQVSNLELEIYCGRKAKEAVLLNLIELLMSQVLKLDGIVADGEVKLQRREQVRRVQKYIETLDLLKTKDAGNEQRPSNEQMPKQMQHHLEQRKQRNLTTQWGTFGSSVAAAPPPFTSSSANHNFRYFYGNPPLQFQ